MTNIEMGVRRRMVRPAQRHRTASLLNLDQWDHRRHCRRIGPGLTEQETGRGTVLGGPRGGGQELYQATVRSERRTGLHDLHDTAAGRLEIEHIDITIPEQIVALHNRLDWRAFDLLLVNAGITSKTADDTIADISTEEFTTANGHQRAEPDAGDRGTP